MHGLDRDNGTNRDCGVLPDTAVMLLGGVDATGDSCTEHLLQPPGVHFP